MTKDVIEGQLLTVEHAGPELRDQFAMHAMHAIVNQMFAKYTTADPAATARKAYEFADAMLVVRGER